MNIFFKAFLIMFASILGIAGVVELQLIGLELMNKPDTFSFYLGVLYCAIVFFIIGSVIYLVVDHYKNLGKVEGSEEQKENK